MDAPALGRMTPYGVEHVSVLALLALAVPGALLRRPATAQASSTISARRSGPSEVDTTSR